MWHVIHMHEPSDHRIGDGRDISAHSVVLHIF